MNSCAIQQIILGRAGKEGTSISSMLLIQYFAKDGAEFGALSANELLKQEWVLGSSTGLHRAETWQVLLLLPENWSRMEKKSFGEAKEHDQCFFPNDKI